MSGTPSRSNSRPITADTCQPGDLLRLANQYLQRNDLPAAYPFVSRLAETIRADAQTSITAGLIALTLERQDEATRHFERAVRHEPDNFDANFNLALVEIQNGRLERAGDVLRHLILCHPENASLHNDLGVVLAGRLEFDDAFDAYARALKIDPNYDQVRRNVTDLAVQQRLEPKALDILAANRKLAGVSSQSLEHIESCCRTLETSLGDNKPRGAIHEMERITAFEPGAGVKGRKIAVFANYASFLNDIVPYLDVENDVRLMERPAPDRVREMMDWADLAWFEWCDDLLVQATRLPKTCPIVCRLHSYEAFTDLPSQVDWSKVDRLIFVNDSVRELFERQVTCRTPKTIIPNGVDLHKFSIPPKKKAGKKIASVGYINYKKNPALLLYCFKKIHEYDPEYSLHIAGQFQDSRFELYFEHFLKNNPLPVTFDGWIDDMPAWYADKDFVISTSLFESFHYSIAEGMASGLLPLVHNWFGASNVYPHDFLFDDPDRCLALLKYLEGADRKELAQRNRRYIEERYALEDTCRKTSAVLAETFAGRAHHPQSDKVRRT